MLQIYRQLDSDEGTSLLNAAPLLIDQREVATGSLIRRKARRPSIPDGASLTVQGSKDVSRIKPIRPLSDIHTTYELVGQTRIIVAVHIGSVACTP